MFETERLILRKWRDEDLDAMVQMNMDPSVMECFPSTLSASQSQELVQRIQKHFDDNGFGLYALELKSNIEVIGFAGLQIPHADVPLEQCVEIGFRLRSEFWGNGYASEAARQALKIGFEQYKLPEIVSFTSIHNKRSIAVMERLGMTNHNNETFEHTRLEDGHRLRTHVVYRIAREEYITK